MKKVNVNKIFLSWICVDANISFNNIGQEEESRNDKSR